MIFHSYVTLPEGIQIYCHFIDTIQLGKYVWVILDGYFTGLFWLNIEELVFAASFQPTGI